jgi:nucleoside-diphosphate-sugar epimerase
VNVLVIGGYGFIGSHLCKKLKEEGVSFDIYDNDTPNGNPSEALKARRKQGLDNQVYDINDLSKYTHIVHLGSLAGPRNGNDEGEFYERNIMGLRFLLPRVSQSQHFTYISSSSIFGTPQTAYSKSKMICEGITRLWSKRSLIIRPFTVYGENGRPEMLVTRCASQGNVLINGDGNLKRKFTYVGDLVRIIIDGIKMNGSGIINAIGRHEYSILDVVRIFGNSHRYGDESPFDFKEQSSGSIVLGEDFSGQNIYCETRIEDVKDKLIEGNRP